MKKVFLSLAAIALVATGSLTMTSCGGDDDTTAPAPNPNPDPNPNPNPTTQSDNTISFEGDEYVLTGQETSIEGQLFNAGEANEFIGPKIYTSSNEPGVAYQKYTQYSYNLNAEGTDIVDYQAYSYYIVNPTVEFNAQGQITDLGDILAPHQVEEMELASAGLVLGGTVMHNSIGALEAGTITYNTFQVGNEVTDSTLELEYESTASYDANVQFADAPINVKVVNLPGFFYLSNPSAGKLSSQLNKNLTSASRAKLVKAIEASQAKINNSNMKVVTKLALKK